MPETPSSVLSPWSRYLLIKESARVEEPAAQLHVEHRAVAVAAEEFRRGQHPGVAIGSMSLDMSGRNCRN
jgi:hypothetical protein